MLLQVGFDFHPLPPAVHDFAAGEILVGTPAVVKGDLVSQEPAPNFLRIVLFDGFFFSSHLRKIVHSLAKKTIPTGRPAGMA